MKPTEIKFRDVRAGDTVNYEGRHLLVKAISKADAMIYWGKSAFALSVTLDGVEPFLVHPGHAIGLISRPDD
jgi:hypothetical protein